MCVRVYLREHSSAVMERLLLFSCRQSIHQRCLPNLALNEQHNPCVCAAHTEDKSLPLSPTFFFFTLIAPPFPVYVGPENLCQKAWSCFKGFALFCSQKDIISRGCLVLIFVFLNFHLIQTCDSISMR